VGATPVNEEFLIPNLDDFESGTITLAYDASEQGIEAAIRAANLDPDLWVPIKSAVTAGPRGNTVRAQLVRRLIRPARINGPRWEKTSLAPHPSHPHLAFTAVVVSDQQCPYHDEYMHEEVCNFLSRNSPQILIVNGDTFDFPEVSSYDSNLRMDSHVNRSIDAGYAVLRDYRSSLPLGTSCHILFGNHEQRLVKYISRHASALYGIHRGGTSDDVLSLPYLARLDELGYQFHTGHWNDWPAATIEITPGLIVKHGWGVRAGSGATARAALEKLGVSIILGHIHRLARVHVTKEMSSTRLVGIEGGTLCQVKDGLGYDVSPDWQNGFTAVKVFSDGTFSADIIEYDPETRHLKYGQWR